jgi:hypothetical protein
MGAEAKKYFGYAMECARQAREAICEERRDKLLELSRVWMNAALTEGNIAERRAPRGDVRGLSPRTKSPRPPVAM